MYQYSTKWPFPPYPNGLLDQKTRSHQETGFLQTGRVQICACKVSHLLLVSDTALKGIRIAETIRNVADNAVKYSKLGLLINRARSEEDFHSLAAKTDLPILGWIPEDELVREFDIDARSFLQIPACPALDAVRSYVMEGDFLK